MHPRRCTTAEAFSAAVLCLITFTAAHAAPQGEAYFDERAKQEIRSSVPRDERPHLVDVGARIIHPRRDTPIELRAGQVTAYVQFDEPLTAQDRARLRREGVRFFGAVGRTTYLVRLRESGLATLRAAPRLRGIEPVVYADRLTARLYRGEVPPYSLGPGGAWSLYVRFYDDVSLPHAIHVLERVGARPATREEFLVNRQLLVHATWEQVFELSETHVVHSMTELPPPPRDDNIVAAAISNVDDVQAAPFNLTGNGVDVGQWESGNPQLDHGDLTPRVTVIDAGAGETGHATHVAGTIMGTGAGDSTALGMAPSVDNLFNYSSSGSTATEHQNAVTNEEIDLANNSWGFSAGWEIQGGVWVDTGNDNLFGLYDAEARDYDTVVRNAALTILKASGNDQNDFDPMNPPDHDGIQGGDGFWYDLITLHGNAKNLITVGALAMNGVNLATFSSAGPADDGRIKPDVVADGTSLWSTCSQTQDGALYCFRGGTSMSTPTTAGVVALLFERYRQQYLGASPPPDVVKALLVNTALDLGRAGPDYLFGHGLADALAAVNTIDVGPVRILTGSVDDGDVDEFLVEVPLGAGRLQATLVWLDPAGVPNSSDPDLIHDLDLLLVDPANGMVFPWSGPGTGMANVANPATATGANTVDNVETATVNAPAPGFWRARVSGSDVAVGPQSYALVLDQSLVLPDQPEITVGGDTSFALTCDGESTSRDVTIYNTGGGLLLVNSVTTSGAPFSLAPNPAPPFAIQPGAQVTVTVNFAPTDQGTTHMGTLTIASNDADEGTLEVALDGMSGVPDVTTTAPTNQTVSADVDVLVEVLVHNEGTCDLILGLQSIDIRDIGTAAGASISFSNNDETNPQVVFPGETHIIPIVCSIEGYGTVTFAYTATTNDPDNPDIDLQFLITAAPPDISVTGLPEFGPACPGETRLLELSVCNTGNGDLSVGGLSLVGDAQITLASSRFPDVVQSGSCLPITLAYDPVDFDEAVTTLLQIPSNDPDEGVLEIAVSGASGSPEIALGIENDFGDVLVGDTGNLLLTINNSGTCDMEVVDLTFSGTSTANEMIAFPFLPPFVVAPGDSVEFPVWYVPRDFVDDTGTLLMQTNVPGFENVFINYFGDSPPPDIATTGQTRFGNVCAGEFAELVFNVCNVGFNHLDVQSVSFVDPCDEFTLENSPFPAVVSHDFCLPVTVRYAPLTPGVHSCILRIVTDDPDEPVVDVVFEGSSGTGDLKTALEANGNFGNVKVGDFRTLEYRITNQGECNLELLSLTRTMGSTEFTLGEQPGSPAFPLTLFPGESASVHLRYEPVDFGGDPMAMDLAMFRLVTDDPDTPTRDFQVQGRSIPPDIEISGSTDFGVVCPDVQAEQTLWICNVGFNDLAVSDVLFDPPCDDFTLIGTPFRTVISKDFCMPLVIRYTPQTTGDHECTLKILSDDPDEPEVTVTVTGTTPEVLLSVPPDQEFPPTVVQQVEPLCESAFPFALTNIGLCNVQILDMAVVPPVGGDPNYTDYTLENLPTLPLTLQPGNRVGNGQARIVFRPTVVAHRIKARVAITYVSHDPLIGDESTVYVELCGEGVNTGARLLVTKQGVPVPHVDKIELWKILDYGLPSETSLWIQTDLDVHLSEVPADPPCSGFLYHVEWGAESNPIVLDPGWYRAESAIGTESPVDQQVYFYIPTVCDFVADVVIDYP